MSEHFASSLPRLVAYSAQQLGWTPDIFWQCTPDELHMALLDPTVTSAQPISQSDLNHLLELDK